MAIEADDVRRTPAVPHDSPWTDSREETCGSLGHPLLRTVTLPDKLHVTRVGTCACGQRVHPGLPPRGDAA
ncbi:MAG: hypothetical protein ACRDJO_07310 [Actinomycetota bacterium]